MELLILVGFAVILWQLWRRLQVAEEKLGIVLDSLEFLRPQTAAYAAPPPPTLGEEFPAPASPELRPEPQPEGQAEAEPAPEVALRASPGEAAEEMAAADQGRRWRGFPRLSFDFEDIFGRRLPIWAGGVALALAGIFLVKFSIEAGLLTPPVRVALSFVFGLLLLAGAEVAYRLETRIADPRVRQALAGAGLATLYAGFYLAGTHYGLIGSGTAFLGLAAVTATAIALSFRFGLPSAVLGLVGGFAAPALVATDKGNVPLLTLYLVLITAALAVTGRRQQRPWLGYLALAGALVWGALLLAQGLAGTVEIVAFGFYVTLLGALVPMLAGGGERWTGARLVAAALASLQLAALIELAGQGLLTWGLYLLLAAALAVLGWRDNRLRQASAFAAAVSLALLALWAAPPPGEFWPVAGGIAAAFVAVPLALVLTGRCGTLEIRQLSLAACALAAVAYWHFGRWDSPGAEPLLAAVAFALATAPAVAAGHFWGAKSDASDLPLAIASAAVLTFAGLLMLVPAWTAPIAAAAVAGVVVGLARSRPAALRELAWAGAMMTVGTLFVTPEANLEIPRLAGFVTHADAWRGAARWLLTAVPFVGLAWTETRIANRRTAEAIVAALAYGALAQQVPADGLPWSAAVAAIAVCAGRRERPGAWGTALAIAGIWAAEPLMRWLALGALALAGRPLLLPALPGARAVLLRLAPAIAALAFAAWRTRGEHRHGRWLLGAAGLIAAIALHILYKRLFALGSIGDFVRLGMAERTVWQGLLTGAGLLFLWRFDDRRGRIAGIALLAASLAHFGWFTLFLHNPLVNAQVVGPWPFASWLLLAYAIAALGLVAFLRLARAWHPWIAPALEAVLMALIALYALSELRHLNSGTMLMLEPMTQGEDLMRSLTGIVLALLYLAWGSLRARRSWRIGSLVLMLLAVGKVFLVDAAGLAGLLRVASFMALGFSLIGIGWVYTRQLARRPAAPVPA